MRKPVVVSWFILTSLLACGGLVACNEEKSCTGIEGEDACRAAGCTSIGGYGWAFISADGRCLARHSLGKVCVRATKLTAGPADVFWFRRRQADGTMVYFETEKMYEAADWEVLGEIDGRNYCDILDPGNGVPYTDVVSGDWYPFRAQPSPEDCEALRDADQCRAAGCDPARSAWFVVSADDRCLARHQAVNVCVSAGSGSNDMNETWYTHTREDGTRDFFLSQATYVFGWMRTSYGEYQTDLCEVLDPGSGVPWTTPAGDGWYPFE
ncbi:hypothetical protein KJ975_08485 [Myxococcota bacterium]|nr:hypothetical protein [Myxococcota bacterium]